MKKTSSSFMLTFSLLISCAPIAANSLRDSLAFSMAFFKNRRDVGSLIPSSAASAKAITKHIKHNDGSPLHILEVGAGTGVLTEEIIKRATEHDQIDVLEIDSRLCEILREKFKDHPNVHVYDLSVLDWHPDYSYDFIVSALPMKSFSPAFITAVWEKYKKIIRNGGIISFLEYTWLTNTKRFFLRGNKEAELTKKIDIISGIVKKFGFETEVVWRNFPPASVYHLRMNK